MIKKRGFTLIEALAVTSIIGVLATLTIAVFSSASARGRDARRKSDLVAISLAFQARYDAQTCSDSSQVSKYPGQSLLPTKWKLVSDLYDIKMDDCGVFSEYLTSVPLNPSDPESEFAYRFDLSSTESGATAPAKHYRLTAHLEKNLSLQEESDLDRLIKVWTVSFGGAELPPGTKSGRYNYVVGK